MLISVGLYDQSHREERRELRDVRHPGGVEHLQESWCGDRSEAFLTIWNFQDEEKHVRFYEVQGEGGVLRRSTDGGYEGEPPRPRHDVARHHEYLQSCQC